MIRARSRWLTAVVLGSTVLAPVAVSFAADAPTTQGPRVKGDWMKKKLNLTDDQAAQMQAIRQDLAPRGKAIGQSLRQTRTELRQLALSGADEATIQAKSNEVTQLLGQFVALRVEGLRRIAPILNDEQKQKLAQMGDGPHHRWHRRGGYQQQG